MAKILVIVDVQNDFIDGSLGSLEAQAAVPKIAEKIKNEPNDTYYIFTKDTHSKDYLKSMEGKKLPVEHCIKNTAGWEIPANLTEYFSNSPYVVEKPTFGSYELIRTIKLFMDSHAEDFDTIEFVGFCTDICVVSNALMAKAAFYNKCEISVDASCCAGTTPENHEAALNVMKSCQINVY